MFKAVVCKIWAAHTQRKLAAEITPEDFKTAEWWAKPVRCSLEQELRSAKLLMGRPWRYGSMCSGLESPVHALQVYG
eukprot:5374485-Amphidinium_carterae.2